MKRLLLILMASVSLFLVSSCDNKEDVSPIQLRLSPDEIQDKSGQIIHATLFIQSPNGVQDINIYKTVNLVKDNIYGDKTVTPQDLGNGQYQYDFTYSLMPEEVDQLVGFNFRVTDPNGAAAEKDLTVHTTASAWQTVFSRKWKLDSRMWITASPPAEDLKDCEVDDVYIFNRDSTYNIEFGDLGCTFDGFNVFEKWWLTEDEKTLYMQYSILFDPNAKTVDTYHVKSISSEAMVLQVTMDLSAFGLSPNETFEYMFLPVP